VVKGHYHNLPPWIRPFDLFWHRRITIVSWGVKGMGLKQIVETSRRDKNCAVVCSVCACVGFVNKTHIVIAWNEKRSDSKC